MASDTGFGAGLIKVDYEKYLSQHDIVYLSPAGGGYEGLPIGNGDLAAMVWTPPQGILCHINKSDLWDDAPKGHFKHWGKKWEEQATCLRSAGELFIQNSLPAFDWKYLIDFEARLQMFPARVTLKAKTPFSSIRTTSFVSRADRCLVIDYEDDLKEEIPRQIILRRWGSRILGHGYHQIVQDPSIGLAGTEAGCDENHIWIVQEMRSLTFALACRVVGLKGNTQRGHSREAVLNTPLTRHARFQVYVSVVTSEENPAPLREALKLVDKASEKGLKSIEREHQEAWKDFWDKSFVNLSDKYIENLWYFNLYQIGSSSRGKYPPHFINGLWSWSHDIRPWNHYYHWNQQSYTWSLHSSGHPELFLPYARWRLEGLPQAMNDAREIFDCHGAWYSDIANRKGYQSVVSQKEVDEKVLPGEMIADHGVTDNLTPGPQIAMDIFRHYQYTLDEAYLRNCAYPVMRECVKFYCDYLKKEEDGRYHIPRSCPYEGNGQCKDTTTDLACIRQLFPAFIEAGSRLDKDVELRGTANNVLENLADFVTMEVPSGVTTGGIDKPSGKILSAGINLEDGKPYHEWLPDTAEKKRVIFSGIQIAPIFPASLVGMEQEGTEEFKVLERTVRCFDAQNRYGIFVHLIALARMGLKGLVGGNLKKWVENYQIFCQGFFSYYQRNDPDRSDAPHRVTPNDQTTTYTVKVIDGQPGEKTHILKRPFIHMGLEPGSIFQTAVNEMLLQSYSGRIRVFPAMPDDWTGSFVLHARGGFIVMSEKTTDGISYVAIESRLGQMCQVVNPWSGRKDVHICDVTADEQIVYPTASENICFNTIAGHIYYVERLACPVESFKGKALAGKPNPGPKKMGSAVLGKPRLF